ncbi:magnesium transporter [Mesomycoplasma hyopneumoniae]|uniref:Magnesium transporter MgtE n=1 Tax=Mesomycoplasma hyopneumoniae TaxID=2099 RepID=A0ABD4SW97_MESHO|nr:magnesium transporter [Mesomycoplasma hyopneumoniae]MCI8283523.1 magnesium transporter [Mesomycoplasma hyopneumoniae]MCI8298453.1 magnesium transporter [Mesomycoplasma hyopneumoniae]
MSLDQKSSFLFELVTTKKITEVRNYTKQKPLSEIAEEVSSFSPFDRLLFFRMLDTATAGDIFTYFSPEIQTKLVLSLPNELINKLLDELYVDEIVELLDEVPDNVAKRILRNIDINTRKQINQLLQYTDDQIGAFMSVDIVYLFKDSTCHQALEKIRNYKDISELVHYYYVVDQNKKIIGATTLEDIVFSDPNTQIKEIVFQVPFLVTTDKKDYAAEVFAKNDFSVLPVVNTSQRLIGMVTSDDIIDIVKEKATSDIYKLAGISPQEVEESYIRSTLKQIVKSRVFWLIILMFGSTLSQFIIQEFTNAISQNNAIKSIGLASFITTIVSMIPVISGSAGNAGSQSATTIVRAISLKEVDKTNFFKKVFFKEISVGLIIGTILMILNFLRLVIYFALTGDIKNVNIPDNSISNLTIRDYILIISAASSISLLVVIIFSKILGAIIPMIAKSIRRDPAVMSAPILATVTDSISTLIFFGITIVVFLLI